MDEERTLTGTDDCNRLQSNAVDCIRDEPTERMMQRTVVKKSGLREADEALCQGQTVGERLEILAELNRVGLAALGMADAPLERRVAKKFPFREFRERVESGLA